MRVSDSQRHTSFVQNVEQRLSNLQRIEQELGTGRSIFSPSEDVQNSRQALLSHSEIAMNEQYQRNIENGQGYVAAADGKLNAIIELLNEVDALALSADNDHMTEQDRQYAAQELNNKLESLMSYANASFGDRYIFGGFGTTTPPFEAVRDEDGLITSAAATTSGLGGRILRTIDRGEDVAINVNGDRLFQPQGSAGTTEDLFYVIAQLRDTIANDNTPPEGQEDTLSNDALRGQLDVIRERITQEQTYLGSLGQRLEDKLSELKELAVTWTDRLETAQGVEMTDLVSRLAVEEGVYNSLLAIQSRILNTSLIDYIG
ncbi:flagellar hook-associated protein FlgL [bacterium]|jgi:flagellar hook-associated protein 3 FlgL|nr:flagellar hook-associated protein FlgL [bacterium]